MNCDPMHRVELKIVYSSNNDAKIVCDCLSVDSELQESKIIRTLNVEGRTLIV